MNRQALVRELQDRTYDLLVIGGGITGAGVALDAASRNLSVALIEMQDFAAGTSSRSTKLIHGGLRYLKQLEISLVREVGRERSILYRNAPHLVVPEKMLLPIVKGGSYSMLTASLGLLLYDRLARVDAKERRIMLSKSQVSLREPLLRTDVLKGAGLYTEYRTDDARLTLEVMKTASRHGAHCLSYAKCTQFEYAKGKVHGAICEDLIGGATFAIAARRVVNAAGPWVDKVRQLDGDASGKFLSLTKGVHLVVPHERLPVHSSVYFEVPDGRMIFVIPRLGISYIGTTDTPYQGDFANPEVTMEDVNYLLDGTNYMFPQAELKMEDIISSYAGLRPLIHEQGKSPSELSRKDELFESEKGLLSIAGGKLTGYRQMAKRTVDQVCDNLDQHAYNRTSTCCTENIALAGGNYDTPEDTVSHIARLQEKLPSMGLNGRHAERLVRTFGSQADEILQNTVLEEDASPEVALILAELRFCIAEEACFNLNDFYLRRTGRIYFEPLGISSSLERAAKEIQRMHRLSEEAVAQQKREVEETMMKTTMFAQPELAPWPHH